MMQTTPRRKRYQKDSTTSDDINTLIQLVRQNPALYNYKLQPNQRRRTDVLNGWQQIAEQLGSKYTVEECRRKWKNLRDTYHQYRLRKPKPGDGLSKWRYAKDLQFLSNVYQPKLKSQRQQQCNDVTSQILQAASAAAANNDSVSQHSDEVIGSHHSHHSGITLVNDADEAFILTTYEESVNDDITTIDHAHDCNSDLGLSYRHHHHGHRHGQQTHDDDDDDDNVVEQIIKNERNNSLDGDEDGAAGTDVDYEEVCLYEESGTASNCETIIPETNVVSSSRLGTSVGNNAPNSNNDTTTINSIITGSNDKEYQYADFCIDSIHSQGSAAASTSNTTSSNAAKLKGIIGTMDGQTIIATATGATTIDCTVAGSTLTSTADTVTSFPIAGNTSSNTIFCNNSNFNGIMQMRHELDLYFDFLKQKMQRFTKEEITAIQIDMLNCVLRRENNNNNNNSISAGNTSGMMK